MDNPFLQRPFLVSPSMNQVRIVDLPGLTVPDWVRGKRGFDLLSSQAMRQQVAIQAQQLGLNPDDPDLLPHFDDCLTAVSPQVRAVAQTIAQDYGRSLGYLLLTLKRGDAINRKARPDWQAAHWAYWQQINAVWLGGGLLSGNLGRVAVAVARTLIHDCGFSDFALELAQTGVTANCISPGYVWTPLIEGQIPDTMKARGLSRDEVINDVLLAKQPTKKFVQPNEIGALVVFLCREEAGNVTGANWSIDGGWTAE